MAKGDQLPIFSSSGSLSIIPETAHGIQAISTQPVKPDFKAHAVRISSLPTAWITTVRFLYDLHYQRVMHIKLCIAHMAKDRDTMFAHVCLYDLCRPAVENRAVGSRNPILHASYAA